MKRSRAVATVVLLVAVVVIAVGAYTFATNGSVSEWTELLLLVLVAALAFEMRGRR